MDRQNIVPPEMQALVERAGYLPGVRVGHLLFCAGQVGRDADLAVIADPEAQFEACWHNLARVLAAAGCGFEDVIDMTSYHIDMARHLPLFRQVKDRVFPRGTCAWTCLGVSELAVPGLLVEIKVTALIPEAARAGL
ncbi:endoribonuclease L-PSP (plasmid) [Paracoccus aminophilus JCM 7686]|uniref:Endoribonuclease L-PSP n=1 Tax=Paracoccus aminophilus JCM 7686 TaxID=1367847 RepID=S5XTS3_PARAH|nr:endoribonuclease L-PSP [Paracoccus aminophilus JCM 7686]